jgi:hypothetical protein
LSDVVRRWWDLRADEVSLTNRMNAKINEENLMDFTSFAEAFIPKVDGYCAPGRMDVVCMPKGWDNVNGDAESPVVIFEFGLDGKLWWKKLDQGVRYLQSLCIQNDTGKFLFKKPILLVVITIDKSTINKVDNLVEVKMGVLLCTRRNTDDEKDTFRLSILWQSETSSVKQGSEMFGRLLRVASDFQEWRAKKPPTSCEYQYLSSNCCKVKDQVR